MNNFFQKKREIIALSFYVCLIVSLVYFVILPILSSINIIRDQIQENALKQEGARKKLSDLPGIQQQYDIIEKDDELANVLLDKDKAVVLIERLEKLAEDSENKITITVQDASTQNTSTPVKLSPADTLIAALPSSDYLKLKITLNGDYNSIVKFVDMLEKFEYYGDITAIQIDADNQLDESSGQSILDPFSGNSTKSIAQKKGGVVASLDIVFYTKKK